MCEVSQMSCQTRLTVCDRSPCQSFQTFHVKMLHNVPKPPAITIALTCPVVVTFSDSDVKVDKIGDLEGCSYSTYLVTSQHLVNWM